MTNQKEQAKRRFLFNRSVKDAGGYQTFRVDAHSLDEAWEILRAGDSDMHYCEVDVTDLGEPEFDQETTLDDYGDFPPFESARPSQAAAVGVRHATIDDAVTALYRRFKFWSQRGFGPDDVTWCEVKADLLAILDMAPAQASDDSRRGDAIDRCDIAGVDLYQLIKLAKQYIAGLICSNTSLDGLISRSEAALNAPIPPPQPRPVEPVAEVVMRNNQPVGAPFLRDGKWSISSGQMLYAAPQPGADAVSVNRDDLEALLLLLSNDVLDCSDMENEALNRLEKALAKREGGGDE